MPQFFAKLVAFFFMCFPKEKLASFIRMIVKESILEYINQKLRRKVPVNVVDISNVKIEEDLVNLLKTKQIDKVHWTYFTRIIKFSDAFILAHLKEVDWQIICTRWMLDENFYDQFADYVDWRLVEKNQVLTETVIRKFLYCFSIENLSKYQKLSEDFIEEFQNEVSWYWVSEKQVLSESFIRKFENNVVWEKIVIFQKLSEEFKIEFSSKIKNLDGDSNVTNNGVSK